MTLKYEGKAGELEGEELVKMKNIYFSKHPEAQKYDTKPNYVFFRVSPSWIRYSDYGIDPRVVFELNHFSEKG